MPADHSTLTEAVEFYDCYSHELFFRFAWRVRIIANHRQHPASHLLRSNLHPGLACNQRAQELPIDDSL